MPKVSEMPFESSGEEVASPVAKRLRVGKDIGKAMGTLVPGARTMKGAKVSTGSTEKFELSAPGSASAAARPTACDITDMLFFTSLLSQI